MREVVNQYIHLWKIVVFLSNYPVCVCVCVCVCVWYSIVFRKTQLERRQFNFEIVNFPFLDGDIVRCIYIAANLFC